MRSLYHKKLFLIGISLSLWGVPVLAFAQGDTPGGLYDALGVATASPGLLVLRILQIAWIAAFIASIGLCVYGFYLTRRFVNDLALMERGGRFLRYGLIIGGVSLVAALILTIVYSTINRRGQDTPVAPISVNQGAPATLATSFLGPTSKIIGHYPGRDDKNIARNASLLITFSDTVDAKTVIAGTSGLLTDRVSIRKVGVDTKAIDATATLDASKKILKITPGELLGDTAVPVSYQVDISPKILFQSGVPVLGGTGFYSWRFEVTNTIDTTPPFVEGVFPGSGKVARNALIQVQFSEAVDPSFLSSGGLEILKQGITTPIEGSGYLSGDYKTLTYVPKDLCGTNTCNESMFCLPLNASMRVVLKAATLAQPRDPDNFNRSKFPYDGIVDLSGNSLDGGGERGIKKNGKSEGSSFDDYSWSFTTSDSLNLEIPRIVSLSPARNSSKVDPNAPVSLQFSHLMDASTLHQGSISLGKTLNSWLDIRSDYKAGMSTVIISHDPFTANTIYRPEATSVIRSVYQQCFSTCSGPIQ